MSTEEKTLTFAFSIDDYKEAASNPPVENLIDGDNDNSFDAIMNEEGTELEERGEGMPLLQTSEKLNFTEKEKSIANKNLPLTEEVINIEDDVEDTSEIVDKTSNSINMDTIMEAVHYFSKHHRNCRVTFMDFSGQSIYYALHQIYLSPKTVYILVLDMSKSFKDKECKSARKTRFESWTFKGS